MTINLSPVPSATTSPWIWPTLAPALPDGLPVGAFTLIRIPTRLQPTGLAMLDDLIASVTSANLRVGLATTDGPKLRGPGTGPASVNVFMAIRCRALSLRLSDIPEFTGGLTSQTLGLSVASALAKHATQEPAAATVGVWWDDPENDADAFYTLKALRDIAHVVIKVVGRDDDGPLLTLSSRTALNDPQPFQKPVPRRSVTVSRPPLPAWWTSAHRS